VLCDRSRLASISGRFSKVCSTAYLCRHYQWQRLALSFRKVSFQRVNNRKATFSINGKTRRQRLDLLPRHQYDSSHAAQDKQHSSQKANDGALTKMLPEKLQRR